MAVRVKLYVSRVNYPGGEVYKFMASMGRQAETAAKAFAPRRSGDLAASIGHERRSNQYGVNLHMTASESYAAYVHQGTTGPITARGKLMPVGATQGRVTHYARQVSGQRANPFLVRGLNVALTRNGLRPVV